MSVTDDPIAAYIDVRRFIWRERGQRERMLVNAARSKEAYWQARVDECDDALEALEALAKAAVVEP